MANRIRHGKQCTPTSNNVFWKAPSPLKAPKRIIIYNTLGGGWTLVASISSYSNEHLLRAEVNCYNSTRCVEFTNTSCRKLSDQDIHEIATQEGIYCASYTKHLARISVQPCPFRIRAPVPSPLTLPSSMATRKQGRYIPYFLE